MASSSIPVSVSLCVCSCHWACGVVRGQLVGLCSVSAMQVSEIELDPWGYFTSTPFPSVSVLPLLLYPYPTKYNPCFGLVPLPRTLSLADRFLYFWFTGWVLALTLCPTENFPDHFPFLSVTSLAAFLVEHLEQSYI